jgi:hypothetical protein
MLNITNAMNPSKKHERQRNGAKSAEFCRKSAEFAEFESIFPNFRDERTKSFPL